jgi:hypothetical protein
MIFNNYNILRIYLKIANPVIVASFACAILLVLFGCSQGTYQRGQHFPQHSFPEGIGTVLFFYTENPEYYQSPDQEFGETENREYLLNRIRIDLNLLNEEYPDLRIIKLDFAQIKHRAQEYLIFDIPTLLLLDNLGFEVRRWIPLDYSRGGGSIREMIQLLDKLNPEY